jgi:hypothetical protein
LEIIAMRGLLGGIIGAVVAATVWLGLMHVTQMDLGWLACAVGVVTGYSVHRTAGPHSGGSFFYGTLSVILALVAIVGGRQVYAKVMEANTGKSPVVIAVAEPRASVVEAETAGDSIATSKQSAPVDERRPAVSLDPLSKPLPKSSISKSDMLWMSLAALAAYIIGKGRDEILPPAASDEPQSEPQSPSANDQ